MCARQNYYVQDSERINLLCATQKFAMLNIEIYYVKHRITMCKIELLCAKQKFAMCKDRNLLC